ncbi:MAG: type II toxin-antitoxin system RelE/ParE family toxin [bacterium]|nr:type II toxin-antitoxin system RelE/ParE family toxin [bacterium]
MKIHWTDTALDHLAAIHDYISQDSIEYAKRMVDRLTTRSQRLGAFPRAGRIVPEFEVEQIREVIEGPYRIIYYIKPDQIDVLAVIHGAQQTFFDEHKIT